MSRVKFKNTGKLKKDFIKKESYKSSIENYSKKPIGIKLPLAPKKNKNKTLFEMTYSLEDQVRINLKNLIMTRKGEYLCLPEFGTNLIDLYNRTDIENVEDIAMAEIQKAVSRYMPFISLSNFTSVKIDETFENPEYHEIKVDYNFDDSGTMHNVIIKLLTSR